MQLVKLVMVTLFFSAALAMASMSLLPGPQNSAALYPQSATAAIRSAKGSSVKNSSRQGVNFINLFLIAYDVPCEKNSTTYNLYVVCKMASA